MQFTEERINRTWISSTSGITLYTYCTSDSDLCTEVLSHLEYLVFGLSDNSLMFSDGYIEGLSEELEPVSMVHHHPLHLVIDGQGLVMD